MPYREIIVLRITGRPIVGSCRHAVTEQHEDFVPFWKQVLQKRRSLLGKLGDSRLPEEAGRSDPSDFAFVKSCGPLLGTRVMFGGGCDKLVTRKADPVEAGIGEIHKRQR